MINEGVVFFAGEVSDIILFMQINIIPLMFSFLHLFDVSNGKAFDFYFK